MVADKPLSEQELALLCREVMATPEFAAAMENLATSKNKRVAKQAKAIQATLKAVRPEGQP